MEAVYVLFISYIVGALVEFLQNALFFVTDFIVMSLTLMPTDPFSGVLDVSAEAFVQYLPWINWFVPLDYAVILFGTYLDVYALYIIYGYTKQIIQAVIDGGNVKSLASAILKLGG